MIEMHLMPRDQADLALGRGEKRSHAPKTHLQMSISPPHSLLENDVREQQYYGTLDHNAALCHEAQSNKLMKQVNGPEQCVGFLLQGLHHRVSSFQLEALEHANLIESVITVQKI